MNKCEEVAKSQTVRLIDCFVIAPFLAYIAFTNASLPMWQKIALYVLAVATFAYNGMNFLQTEGIED